MRIKIALLFSFVILNSLSLSVHAQYDVREFGAKGDGMTLDTHSIQNAIDKATSNGGGTVEIPTGINMIGTLILKDNYL